MPWTPGVLRRQVTFDTAARPVPAPAAVPSFARVSSYWCIQPTVVLTKTFFDGLWVSQSAWTLVVFVLTWLKIASGVPVMLPTAGTPSSGSIGTRLLPPEVDGRVYAEIEMRLRES